MKIGDRVIVNGEYDGIGFDDDTGQIIDFMQGDVIVCFDKYINGYSYCSLLNINAGYCWHVSPEMIKKEDTMKERIEALEKELAALKACQKYEPKGGSWSIQGTGRVTEKEYRADDYIKKGRAFDTKEKAKKARDIMVKHDIILKYVIDHAPDYEPDEDDTYGVCFSVYEREWYVKCRIVNSGYLGNILMPKHVAEKLADDLNNNRIEGM